MKVIKRDGTQAEFEPEKIRRAIESAYKSQSGKINDRLIDVIVTEISEDVVDGTSIEEIESMVYNKLIAHKQKHIARAYEGYRAVREHQRKTNTIDQKIKGVIKGNNFDIKDNSNKDTKLVSTMRDLVAEEVSKDYALRMMLPADIANAHNEGLIYIHDLGHYLNPSFNCCLVNLEDMLQNDTVINRKLIRSPHSFRTACTVATQIIAQVASGQFGGQTITLTHLAPFVRVSENAIREEVIEDLKDFDTEVSQEKIDSVVARKLKKEITAGIQTIQYQINTLQTSNGR